MFIIFGLTNKDEVMGPIGQEHCSRCNNTDHWQLCRTRRMISFFFIPMIPLGAEHMKVCPVCREVRVLNKQEFDYWRPMAELNQSAANGEVTREEYDIRMSQMNY